MASTMPSATAWRARSWLVQCVICSPSAIGSRQARSTTWARCRGGKLQRMPPAGLLQQEALPAAVLIAATDPPDGGRVAFHAGGHRVDRFTTSHGQHNVGMLDLEPSPVPGSGDRLE